MCTVIPSFTIQKYFNESFKAGRDEVLHVLLTQDFQEWKKQVVAVKCICSNGKHRRDLAVTFFLLDGDLRSDQLTW